MTTTTTTTTTMTAKTKRHPIRGFLYGIPFGLGIAMIAIGQKWAALGTWPPFILFVAGIVVSMLWSTFGPAKAPKEPPPVGASDAVDTDIAATADTVEVTVTETETETETKTKTESVAEAEAEAETEEPVEELTEGDEID